MLDACMCSVFVISIELLTISKVVNNTDLKSAGNAEDQVYIHCFIVIATLLPHTAIV